MVAQACNPSTLGGRGRWITRSRDRDHPGQHGETLSLLKIQKIGWAWWHVPVIPATQEAEAGELPEPRRRRLWWAEITPLHSSLGNKSETLSQKKKKNKTKNQRKQQELLVNGISQEKKMKKTHKTHKSFFKNSDVTYVKHITDYIQLWRQFLTSLRLRCIKEEGNVTLLPCESPWQVDWDIPFQSALDEANQNPYDTVRNTPAGFWEKEKEVEGVLVKEHSLLNHLK